MARLRAARMVRSHYDPARLGGVTEAASPRRAGALRYRSRASFETSASG
jgi:hypothetical protein